MIECCATSIGLIKKIFSFHQRNNDFSTFSSLEKGFVRERHGLGVIAFLHVMSSLI